MQVEIKLINNYNYNRTNLIKGRCSKNLTIEEAHEVYQKLLELLDKLTKEEEDG